MNRIETQDQQANTAAICGAADKSREIIDSSVELSVVVPLFNEADSLMELTRKICEALEGLRFEILFVDDGSRDDSWQIVRLLSGEDPRRIRGMRHRRNFGKAEALATGFKHVRGKFVATIDADLQDDPMEIPALLKKLEEGFDLVSGWKQRRHDPISKTVPSRFFNAATRAVSGLPLHDFNCGLKVYRREVVGTLDLYGELHRFIPVLAHSEGFHVTELPVQHFPRKHGVSKYGWKRLFKGALDLFTIVLLTRYRLRPGHFFGAFGIIVGTFGMGILGYLSAAKIFFDVDIQGRPLFFLGILATLFSGQLISTGFICEFLLRNSSEERVESRVARRTDLN